MIRIGLKNSLLGFGFVKDVLEIDFDLHLE